MKFKFYILSALAWLALLPAAHASGYKPGSVGYLYESCREAVESGENLADLYGTYCGAFVEGYIAAYMASGARAFETPKGDPCAEDKKKLFEQVNNRFCPGLPFYDQKKITAGIALQDMAGIVSRWVNYQRNSSNGHDPLRARAATALGTLLQPGEFCTRLDAPAESIEPLFEPNPALQKINWKDSLKLKDQMTLMAKYRQCEDDLLRSGGDEERFRATRCGAEIEGYIAGLHAASLQESSDPPAPECKKEVRRLARHLDVKHSMCASPDTDPLRVAKIFLEQVERKTIPERKVVPASVGYEAIYRGFLCVEKHADSRP